MGAEWDADAFKSANPSYDVIIRPEEIAKAAVDAKNKPEEENIFRRYRLNQWVQQFVRWLSLTDWKKCQREIDEDTLVGRRCFGGLDLASKLDLAAWMLIFPPDEGRADDPHHDKWVLLSRVYCPSEVAVTRQRQSAQAQYATWGNSGDLTLTPGNVIDYETIRHKIIDDRTRFDVQEIGACQWNLEYIRQRLPDIEIIEVPQTFKGLSEPSKELAKILRSGELIHDGNAVTGWAVGNVAIRCDPNDNIAPDKKHSAEKIDPVAAAVNAMSRAMLDCVVDDGCPLVMI